MSDRRYTHFSDADMNVIIHEDSSFGALKTVHHPFWEWGTIGTFPTNGRGSEVLRTQKAKFFWSVRGKKLTSMAHISNTSAKRKISLRIIENESMRNKRPSKGNNILDTVKMVSRSFQKRC